MADYLSYVEREHLKCVSGYAWRCVFLVFLLCPAGCSTRGRSGADTGPIQRAEPIPSAPTTSLSADVASSWEWKDERALKLLHDARRLHFVDARYGWAVGWEGLIARTTDGGDTWIRQRSNTKLYIRDVWFANREIGWALGEVDSYGQPTGPLLLYTDNGGTDWQRKEPPVPFLASRLNFFDQNSGWLTGYDRTPPGQGLLAHTTDGGDSWSIYRVPDETARGGESTISDLSFVSPSEGWAVGDHTIRHTTDAGMTWQTQYIKPLDWKNDYLFQWVQFVDPKFGWAIGVATGDLGNVTGVVRTTDGGATWQESTLQQMFNAVRFIDSNVGIAVGYVFVPQKVSKSQGTRFPSEKLPPTDGVVLLTSNGGVTWNEIRRVNRTLMFDLAVAQDRNAWVLGERGIVLRHSPMTGR